MKRKLLIVICMFCMFFFKNVNAKVYTLEEVSNYYNNFVKENYKDALYSKYDDLRLSIYDKDDNKLIMQLTNENDNLAYYFEVNETTDTTNAEVPLTIALNISVINEAIQNMMGYKNYIINEDDLEKIIKNYDKYGFLYKTKEIHSEGENYSYTLSYITEYKVSLDSEKWANLINDYGIIAVDFTPTIENITIDKNKVTIKINSNYKNENNNKLLYDVYRSETENGKYTKINDTPYDYNKVKEITDTIDEGKTYYYKVSFLNSNNESTIKSITNNVNETPVKEDENKNDSENKENEKTTSDGRTNPKTGNSINILAILILMISFIIIKKKSSKKYF